MSVSVYLADLRYNYSGVLANDCMPLGIAYIKAVMDRDLPDVESRLFVYPERLGDALASAPPAVLMLSNYCWNERLSFHLAKLAKRIRPATLTVLGGPNIPIESERQLAFVRDHPEIDVYVLGEGDFLATELVRRFLDAGQSISRFAEEEIPSSIYRRPDGGLHVSQMWARHKEIDEIPSPWLTGIQDEFFDGKLAPMIETNRGCPFACSFCVQGTGWYTKVHNFGKERLKEELEYIARRLRDTCPEMGTLRIADSNYGMFERDVEISGYIGEIQKRYGWPTFIDATTGKNRPERIIQSVEKVSGALVVYQAVQSLDERTLKNIKRSTIKLEAYEQIQIHVRGRGLRSNSDLILGLPGETLQTHLDAIHKLVNAGTSEMHNFQAMLLKGSEMETVDARNQYAFQSRFRVLPKNFGVYAGEKVFDMDEIVVATDTMSFSDYVDARKYHVTCSIFWNNGWFQDAIDFARHLGVTASQWLDAVRAAMERTTDASGALLKSFATETVNELFPTPEACASFYAEETNFQQLRLGGIGDNLMYKYRALASFQCWPAICATAMDATKELVVARRARALYGDFDRLWADIHRYCELRHAHGYSECELLAPARARLAFHVPRWIAAGHPSDLEPYRLSEPVEFEFRLPQDAAHELRAALQVWTADLKALSKMVTRIRPEWQTRDCTALTDGVDIVPRIEPERCMAADMAPTS